MNVKMPLATIVLLGLAGAGDPGGAAGPGPEPGRVSGRVTVELPGVKLADLLPVVVYLDGTAGRLSYTPPADIPVITQKEARFSPAFLVIAAGQTVALVNDDRLVHNVFSYSPPKRFDLGLYPAGETRTVTIDKPGVTELFCSIHSKMNATIFVAPSPYAARVEPGGRFDLGGVPPGRYLLKAWCRKLPLAQREVEVIASRVTEAPLSLPGESR